MNPKVFENLPEVDWDGKSPIYSDVNDVYYSDLCEAECSLEEGQTLADLQLMPCSPQYVSPLTIDYLEGLLPEAPDDIIPKEIEDAMDVFNKAVEDIIISWYPYQGRISISDIC